MATIKGDVHDIGKMDCINESSGDFIAESAMSALAKIGAEARQAIMSRWSDLDSSQRIYGYGVLERTGRDERTAQFLKERFPEARPQPGDLELWCAAVEAVPDQRLVEVLEGELHRKLSL